MIRTKAVWGLMVVLTLVWGSASPAQAQELRETAEAVASRIVASEHSTGKSKLLPVLFGSYAAIQVLDVVSTRAALQAGAQESNPLVAPMAGNSTKFFAVKALTTVTTLAYVKRMEKRHKKAAIVTMFVLNGVTAAVVANNMKHARR